MRDSMPSAQVAAGNFASRETHAGAFGPRNIVDLGEEPPPHRPRDRTAWQLRVAARACAEMGSPLYGHLLDQAAGDCAGGGATWTVLSPHAAPGRADALALRFMAAVHRLVLLGQAPELAAYYPSAGGSAALDGVWDAFQRTLTANIDTVRSLVHLPCQTNEVGRSAGLAVGFLEVMHRTGLPLRLLEVGASAGLNLRCDHFRIGGGGKAIGDPASPVDLSEHWRLPPPHIGDGVRVSASASAPAGGDLRVRAGGDLHVVERRGCDRHPVDATTPEGRLALMASVWADQRARLDRLRGAIELARRYPAEVDRASLDTWTEQQVDTLPSGCVTVVFHSVVSEYLPAPVRDRFVAALHRAGARATPARPFAWVRLEPISHLRYHGIQLTLWPGGDTRVIARCGAHGTDVEWLGDGAPR